MSILHYYLGRPAHVWIAMSRRSPASPRPASPARLGHGGQSESAAEPAQNRRRHGRQAGVGGQEQRGDAPGLVHGRQLMFMTQVGSVAHTADG